MKHRLQSSMVRRAGVRLREGSADGAALLHDLADETVAIERQVRLTLSAETV
jgi:hypothetical protein